MAPVFGHRPFSFSSSSFLSVSSLGEIQRVLTSAGFCQVKSIRQLVDRTFCWDRHCGDTLAFPACCRSQLHSTGLLSDCKLAIQVWRWTALCETASKLHSPPLPDCFSHLDRKHHFKFGFIQIELEFNPKASLSSTANVQASFVSSHSSSIFYRPWNSSCYCLSWQTKAEIQGSAAVLQGVHSVPVPEGTSPTEGHACCCNRSGLFLCFSFVPLKL